jgi:hypothetical protein
MNGECTINVTSASTGLFGTAKINFDIAQNTLVISPTTLASDSALYAACNLKIEDWVLSKRVEWTYLQNSAFIIYLNNLHITTIRFEGISSIADRAFYSCSALTSLDLSNCTSLTTIGDRAFENCTRLTSITFPLALTEIVSTAFSGCTAITSIDLSTTSVTKIGESTFEACVALTTLKLSPTMFASGNSASFGNFTFRGCANLTAIYFPANAQANLSNYGYGAFSNCPSTGIIYCPAGKESIAEDFRTNISALKN